MQNSDVPQEIKKHTLLVWRYVVAAFAKLSPEETQFATKYIFIDELEQNRIIISTRCVVNVKNHADDGTGRWFYELEPIHSSFWRKVTCDSIQHVLFELFCGYAAYIAWRVYMNVQGGELDIDDVSKGKELLTQELKGCFTEEILRTKLTYEACKVQPAYMNAFWRSLTDEEQAAFIKDMRE